jgi:hypothetical protein
VVFYLSQKVPGSQLYKLKGAAVPPKNKRLVTVAIIIILLYSLIKKRANPILAYSTLYPATNSASASGKSNGARFYSAKQHTIQIYAIGHYAKKNQPFC